MTTNEIIKLGIKVAINIYCFHSTSGLITKYGVDEINTDPTQIKEIIKNGNKFAIIILPFEIECYQLEWPDL